MLVIGSNVIDVRISQLFSYITKLWVRITKQKNTRLAWWLWGFAAGTIISFMATTGLHLAWGWLGLLVWPGWMFHLYARLSHMQSHIEDPGIPEGIIPIPPRCLLTACRGRQLWVLMLLINTATPPWVTLRTLPFVFGLAAGALSQYVMLHIDMGFPKKDSVWSRARSWLRSHAPSLGPVVAPSPA